jgi:hypothetical protein
MRVREVLAHEVEAMMPFIYPYLKQASDHSREQCVAEEFEEGIKARNLIAFMVYGSEGVIGCFTMGLLIYHSKRIAEVVTITIDAPDEDWIPAVFEAVNEWACRLECSEIEATGRPGWAKKLTKAGIGCKTTFMTVGKKVEYAKR